MKTHTCIDNYLLRRIYFFVLYFFVAGVLVQMYWLEEEICASCEAADSAQAVYGQKMAQRKAIAAACVVADESTGKILSARIVPLGGKHGGVQTEVTCEKRLVVINGAVSVPIGSEGRWETTVGGSHRFYWPAE